MIAETDTEGLAAALSERFGVGTPTAPLTPVDRGFTGQVWQLATETGRWAAKMLFEGADPAGAEQDVRLQEAALGAGLSLPRPGDRPTAPSWSSSPSGAGGCTSGVTFRR